MNIQNVLTSSAIAYTLLLIAIILFAFVVLKTRPQKNSRRR